MRGSHSGSLSEPENGRRRRTPTACLPARLCNTFQFYSSRRNAPLNTRSVEAPTPRRAECSHPVKGIRGPAAPPKTPGAMTLRAGRKPGGKAEALAPRGPRVFHLCSCPRRGHLTPLKHRADRRKRPMPHTFPFDLVGPGLLPRRRPSGRRGLRGIRGNSPAEVPSPVRAEARTQSRSFAPRPLPKSMRYWAKAPVPPLFHGSSWAAGPIRDKAEGLAGISRSSRQGTRCCPGSCRAYRAAVPWFPQARAD